MTRRRDRPSWPWDACPAVHHGAVRRLHRVLPLPVAVGASSDRGHRVRRRARRRGNDPRPPGPTAWHATSIADSTRNPSTAPARPSSAGWAVRSRRRVTPRLSLAQFEVLHHRAASSHSRGSRRHVALVGNLRAWACSSRFCSVPARRVDHRRPDRSECAAGKGVAPAGIGNRRAVPRPQAGRTRRRRRRRDRCRHHRPYWAAHYRPAPLGEGTTEMSVQVSVKDRLLRPGETVMM